MAERRASPWIQPGWYVAICEGCQPIRPLPFKDRAERDEWAEKHRGSTGHFVERVEGEQASDD
jgi:hypothetical protein